jgi:hypothetical protein
MTVRNSTRICHWQLVIGHWELSFNGHTICIFILCLHLFFSVATERDSSPLPPAILHARGFGMTRETRDIGKRGRAEKNTVVTAYYSAARPRFPLDLQSLVIQNHIREAEGKSGDGSHERKEQGKNMALVICHSLSFNCHSIVIQWSFIVIHSHWSLVIGHWALGIVIILSSILKNRLFKVQKY